MKYQGFIIATVATVVTMVASIIANAITWKDKKVITDMLPSLFYALAPLGVGWILELVYAFCPN